jgi:hypothetical protein
VNPPQSLRIVSATAEARRTTLIFAHTELRQHLNGSDAVTADVTALDERGSDRDTNQGGERGPWKADNSHGVFGRRITRFDLYPVIILRVPARLPRVFHKSCVFHQGWALPAPAAALARHFSTAN